MNPSNKLALIAAESFRTHFGYAHTHLVQAPGRVNLIGEHTDYNDGFVLPCAINYGTVIAGRPRDDSQIRVVAIDIQGQLDTFFLNQPIISHAAMPWANYVRGMVKEMLTINARFSGFDLAITGNVPRGAGLSSSASLEVAVGQAIKTMYGLNDIDNTALALTAQRAENLFVGCNCGIMDQLVSAQGRAGHALLIDCRSLLTQQVALPPDTAVLVAHSRVARGLVDSEYNTRRLQCEIAARHIGVPALRDVKVDAFTDSSDRFGLDELVFRRARHVVTENQRTLDASHSLANGDMHALGNLMAASHLSMKDDFEITVPPIDALVNILQDVISVHGSVGGARMTGGGFGGCVVAILPTQLVEEAVDQIAKRYRAPNGENAIITHARPAKVRVNYAYDNNGNF